MLAVQDRVKQRRPHKTVLENPVRGKSQTNGFIENANHFVAAMIRALRSFVNAQLGAVLDSNHNVMTWIVKYAGTLIDMFHVGWDVRNTDFRRKGKNAHPVFGTSL